MQSECFGRSRSDATRSEEKVRYSTFTLDNWYKANLTPMLCNKISCVFLKVKEFEMMFFKIQSWISSK